VPRAKNPTPRRRTRGEGTLYEKIRTWKTSDGKTRSKKMWVAAISDPDRAGEPRGRRRRFFYGSTATAARAARDRYLSERGKPLPVEPTDSTTVSEYADRFVTHTKEHARAATAYSYDRTLRLHVLPHIGRVSLADLSPERIKALYDTLRGKVSPSMLARVHIVLRAMLNLAVEERVIPSTPLASIRKTAPRHKRPKIEALTERQAKALLKAAKGDRLEALFVLALTTGMRQGELFALQWADVDLRRRTLYVQRSAQEVSGEITIVEPKTDSSRRRVALTTMAVEALKRRRAIGDKEGHGSELVFPSERGYVQRKSNFLRKDWEPIRTAAGLSDTRFHDLRHTAASLLLIEGVHPKVVSEMLGHASIRLTLDTYSHLIPTLQATAVTAFDKVLGGKAKAGRRA
jgi:integrase